MIERYKYWKYIFADYSPHLTAYIYPKIISVIKHLFFKAIGIEPSNKKKLNEISSRLQIPIEQLKYYDDNNVLPSENDLRKIEKILSIHRFEIMIRMQITDTQLFGFLNDNLHLIKTNLNIRDGLINDAGVTPFAEFRTELGQLYRSDCLELMKTLPDESIDLIFADPPFNLSKIYLSGINDSLSSQEYLTWSQQWISECVRLLKPGGSFYLWNLPKWNTYLSDYLNSRLIFKHWIATDIKLSLPIANRFYPAHYSLLFYTKGMKPNSFHPDRMPMQICNNCFSELKDYGGYKNKMNPKGINMSDVWYDIPPVRHKKYKGREEANELSIKILDRIIETSSEPGDLIFDPFGGSGTTYIVAEIKKRKWIGCEVGPIDSIVKRFSKILEEEKFIKKIREQYNVLFPPDIKRERKKRRLWTDDEFHNPTQTALLE